MAAIRSYAYLAYFLVFLSWGFCSAHRPVLTFKDDPVADKPGGLGIQKRFEGIWSWGNGGGGSIGFSPSGISGTIFGPRSGHGSGVGVELDLVVLAMVLGVKLVVQLKVELVVLVLILVLTVEKLKVIKVLAMVQTLVLVLLVVILTLGLELMVVM